MSAGRKRKSIVFRLIVIAFCCIMIYNLFSLQSTLSESKQELFDLQQQISQVSATNEELTQLLANGTEQDFIERAARERLGYVYADEEVYTDISGN